MHSAEAITAGTSPSLFSVRFVMTKTTSDIQKVPKKYLVNDCVCEL
jgi:hypothetical protein